ncbi:MAG TPA: UDP-N-acetylglucosamine 2-epimerase (non-hydrolyzing) [Deltaproteobacteria bacterium]|nr:UDP-N-acetylglucosamine 2-epimerase (non-hydrolyzing) [Deltaproteobacteria bacterium]HCP48013.1 UDP-N-acetylglucosamine 2-epimerase (non-hydrolyzing) [Deltaproteobacteria bacterium]
MDRRLTIALAVGARPNLPKVAPVLAALRGHDGVRALLVHTGQHDSPQLSTKLLQELGIPTPDVQFHASKEPSSARLGSILGHFERWCRTESPDAVVVFGDVDSTVACALGATRAGIPVVHVEAGLRSFDPTMVEEINRRVTDAISSRLYTHCDDAVANLRSEGVPQNRICQVGNVMIDTLQQQLPSCCPPPAVAANCLRPGTFGLVTLHRPALVDDARRLGRILAALEELSCDLPLLFPAHPRTAETLRELRESTKTGLSATGVAQSSTLQTSPRLVLCSPLAYRHFLWTMKNARLVITDSGGVQEETTWLNIPCLTVRENTERPVTVHKGTNRLVGLDPRQLLAAANEILGGQPVARSEPPALWDGRAGQRIADDLLHWLKANDRVRLHA